ncbi:MAG: hypothetical protein IJW79_12270 [Clostridia bacterium]|nr:hypothetical protein [Clostridia bacterium]
MARFDAKTLEIIKRLQNARLSLMANQPFYALLLMNLKFALDVSCETAYTDGERIAFNPDFINELDDGELEFVLMHEVLHVVLAHPFRHQSDYEMFEFDIACDIIVNSNILYSFGNDKSKITLKKYGESMHCMPNGDEGYEYSLEEAYQILLAEKYKKNKKQSGGDKGKGKSKGETKGVGNGNGSGASQSAEEEAKGNGNGNGQGKGIGGKGNSGESKTPPTLEELIASIKNRNEEIRKNLNKEGGGGEEKESNEGGTFDDHSFWNGDDAEIQRDTWRDRMIKATELINSLDSGNKSRGIVPVGVERIVEELKKPILDWRTILNDFVQEEICDYSFTPPDKRMEDSPFFLPDFNEKDEKAKDLLFMIDTSASMSQGEITECYSEVYGAIQQFNGKLTGKLGFFDAVVVEPIPFEDEDEFKIIRPKGGGGTSFHAIFDYVKEHMQDETPVSIIILTDGYASFPDEEATMGIPVLWVINNNKVNPPWGKVARLVEEKK